MTGVDGEGDDERMPTWSQRCGWGCLIVWLAALPGPARAGDPPICREVWGAGSIRVACVGDSNTQSDWQIARPDGFSEEDGWCERLADGLLESVNCGWGGATAFPNGWNLPHFHGAGQVEAALADPGVDVLLLALGTNDLAYSILDPDHLLADDLSPEAVADRIQALALAATAGGAAVLVATIPYRLAPTDPAYLPPPPGIDALVAELNAELAQRFAPESRVDFTSEMTTADFLSDGLHVNASGMARRAEAARAAVYRLLPEPGRAALPAVLLALLACRAAVSRAGGGAGCRRPRR